MVKIQIDIIFSMSMVSYFAKNPKPNYFNIVNQSLKYLASSQNKGITFEGEPELC